MSQSNISNEILDHPRRWKQPSLDVLSCLFLVSNYPSQAGFVKSWLYPVVVGAWAQLDLELLMLKIHSYSPHSIILPLQVLCSWSVPPSLFPFPPKLGPAEIRAQGIIHRFTRKPQSFLKHPHLDLWSEENQVRIDFFPHLCPSIPCTSLIQH